MRITEVAKITAASPDEIRYFERKGYVRSRRKLLNKRRVRDYSQNDVELIGLIAKHRREGYNLEASFQKAQNGMQQPRLV